MAGSHLGRSVVIVARPPPPIMVLVVVAHRSPRLWRGGHDRDHDHDREAGHDHDQPLSPPLPRSPHFYYDCGTPPTQEGRTSTGWKFPLKSFWLRSHFGSRKLHATKVFCCWVTWQCRLVHEMLGAQATGEFRCQAIQMEQRCSNMP